MKRASYNGHTIKQPLRGEPGLMSRGGSLLEKNAFLILLFLLLAELFITTHIRYPEVAGTKALLIRQGVGSNSFRVEWAPQQELRAISAGTQGNITLLSPAGLQHRSVKVQLPEWQYGRTLLLPLPGKLTGSAADMPLPDTMQAEIFIPVKDMSLLQRMFSRQAKRFN
ncbi:hypothetical protein SAMN04488505_108252 [Chitinophaga rupis]|uniref:Uncharacterized protein n=1 Tax=Chitinophaga rupis TaxID=573321 RepID=A0A1H8ECP9_9BACT|nr:hypothetical protein [Chitinophaga rupis]SEN17292.1 hypothetical protein SAMN04488505_108252 [Chitinophaga rupis]